MGRSAHVLLVLTAVCGLLSVPAKSDYAFRPDDADLADFPHDRVLLWEIDLGGLAPNESLTGAELFIDNINNTNPWSSNALYIHLLDDDPIHQAIAAGLVQRLPGTQDVYWATDPLAGGDTLAGQGILLTTYHDTNGSASYDLHYWFTPAQLETLRTYLADGAFGLGFDPDCHFNDSGVKLTLHTQTSTIPAPGAILLGGLGTGLVGWFRRRRMR